MSEKRMSGERRGGERRSEEIETVMYRLIWHIAYNEIRMSVLEGRIAQLTSSGEEGTSREIDLMTEQVRTLWNKVGKMAVANLGESLGANVAPELLLESGPNQYFDNWLKKQIG